MDLQSWDSIKQTSKNNEDITVSNGKVIINNRSIFHRVVVNENIPQCDRQGNILLLHAGCYSSQTWLDHGTMHVMANRGFRTAAIDMPGYGETGGVKMDTGDPIDFMKSLIQVLGIPYPIIVSPSRSGDLTIPLIIECPELVRGYVPVSPHSTDKYSAERYRGNQTNALITYGENDTEAGRVAVANLKNLPNHTAEEFLGAGHHPYMDNPGQWHQLLLNFINSLPQ
ncbi:putative protein-lysine deacylase ABHD14B [Amphiura filiformis]|uniref:putative protein-lysine deacylase ABHD14B n=1 Tax=Amphiura filiformis TaxID=82378 RepID=UPI003B21FC62